MPEAALLLGSNLGDKLLNITNAIALIEDRVGAIVSSSNLYKTEPWGLKEQPYFVNQAILVQTEFAPQELMRSLLYIEEEFGRTRDKQWGARIIDIDILFYENRIIDQQNLQIPHPRLHERRFTLAPLAEIAADWTHPILHERISSLLISCPDNSAVEQINAV